jgi:hypothetical protein
MFPGSLPPVPVYPPSTACTPLRYSCLNTIETPRKSINGDTSCEAPAHEPTSPVENSALLNGRRQGRIQDVVRQQVAIFFFKDGKLKMNALFPRQTRDSGGSGARKAPQSRRPAKQMPHFFIKKDASDVTISRHMRPVLLTTRRGRLQMLCSCAFRCHRFL